MSAEIGGNPRRGLAPRRTGRVKCAGRHSGLRALRGSHTWRAGSHSGLSSASRSVAGNFGVDALQQVLHIGELLRQFPDARLHFLQIVLQALGGLCHRSDARSGIGLHFLHNFLQVAHLRVQLIGIVEGLLHQRFDSGAVGVESAA